MKALVKVIILFLLSLGSRQSFSQGKMDRSKQEIKKGTKEKAIKQVNRVNIQIVKRINH
jgi:hypothetical protein